MLVDKLKDTESVIYDIRLGGKNGKVVGVVTAAQAKEAADFIREKWKTEPEFYYSGSYGWLDDPDGNRYEIKEEIL